MRLSLLFWTLPGEWSSNTVFEIFTFCLCAREEDGSFFKCFVPVPLGPPLCFWQNQSLQSKLLCFPTGNKWENLALCESVPCCGGRMGTASRTLYAHSLAGISGHYFSSRAVVAMTALVLQPPGNCLLQELTLRRAVQAEWNHSNFSRARLIVGAHRLLVCTDMLLWCR